MILNYPIASFDQVVHLVRPEQPDVLSHMTGQTLGPDLGWGELLGDRLRLHQSPGDHFSMINGEQAARLADLLRACLVKRPQEDRR
jgi:thioesterase domain-containing protein